jgi:hypothetical protein
VSFYYGSNPPWDELQAFDAVVVEPGHTIDPRLHSSARSALFAHVSVGEVKAERPYAEGWETGNRARQAHRSISTPMSRCVLPWRTSPDAAYKPAGGRSAALPQVAGSRTTNCRDSEGSTFPSTAKAWRRHLPVPCTDKSFERPAALSAMSV